MRSKGRFALSLLAIVAVGAVVRFWRLDLCMWGGDHAEALSRALDFVHYGRFPLRGLDASVGRPNPPGFIWLVAIPAAIRPTPVFATGFVALLGALAVGFTGLAGRQLAGPRAGLFAAALLALSPWAVIHSRSLWSLNVLPFFSSATLWLLAKWLRRPRGRWIVAAGLVALFMPQVHFSAVAVLPAVALAAWAGWRRWKAAARRKALAAGVVALGAAAAWAPYAIDARLTKTDPSRSERLGSAWWRVHGPKVPRFPAPQRATPARLLFPSVIAQTLNMHSADFLEYWVGDFEDTMHIHRALWKTYGAIAGAALVVSAVSAAGLWRRRGPRSARQIMALAVLLWLVLPGAALCTRIQMNYPFYFIICHPAGFLLMARQAALARRAPASRWLERRFSLLILLCLAFAAVYLYCLAGDLEINRGFPDGLYGTAYRFLADG